MGNIYTKGASLILQIIFVVALVLVFAWFDPFDIFTPSTLKLKDTPVQVESIKEIGQLISAEYYGEVISSLQEIVNEKDFNSAQQFDSVVNDLHEEFKNAVTDFSQEKIRGNVGTIYQAFADEYPDIVNHRRFGPYLYFINEKIRGRKYNHNDSGKTLSRARTQRLIKRLYKNSMKWRDKLMALKTDEFKQVSRQTVQKHLKKEFRHSRLVMVGRGWVKAGFDFRKFSNRNFVYDSKYQRIHFIGLEPEILSATINPWFIPEKGVEGFEFLIAERGARFKPEYTNLVKQRCLDKLQQQAMEKQILLKAKKNAEQNLKDFFSILLNTNIKGVYFHTNYLTYMANVFLHDSVVANEELFTVDSAISYYYHHYNHKNMRKTIAGFIALLQKHHASVYDVNIRLNSYSSLLFKMVSDRRLDSAEIVFSSHPKPITLMDTLWHSNLFMSRYFNTVKDTLSIIERRQIDSAFRASQQTDYKNFTTDLNRLVKALKIEVDSSNILGE